MAVGDTGISASYKTPRYIAKIVFAAGPVSAASQQLRCLLVGMKTSSGSIVPDAPPIRASSIDDVDAFCGPGSQLAMMGYAALSIPGIELWLAAVSEPSSGTAATVTIVFSGAWTTPGTLRFRLAGKLIAVDIGATSEISDLGAAAVASFNAKQQLPATAAFNSGTGTLTLTLKNKGVGGKDWTLYYDPTYTPAGLVVTMTGSASQNTNGVRFGASSTGTGAEDATTILTKLTKSRFARIAVGHNDVTNAPLWEAGVNADAAPLSLILDQLVFAHNGSKSQVTSLAQTTLNAERAQVLYLRNSENHPSEIAALVAAIRSSAEQSNPITDYDGYPLPYLAPQAFDDDVISDDDANDLLNAGVTPLTTVDGTVRIVRAICSYCVSNGQQDERCLDIGDVVMTDYATLDMKLMYETEFRPANPIVQDDPAPEEDPPPAGVGYPLLWNSLVSGRLKDYKSSGWVSQDPVGTWAPVSYYNDAGGFIASDTPLPVSRLQHRLDNVMRQIATVG